LGVASYNLFCSGAPELTDLMSSEAAACGAARISESGAGIECYGSIETGYRLCLWSRVMNRVQIRLVSGSIETTDELYELARTVLWDDHLGIDGTFAVRGTMSASRMCTANFAALRVKDAIADQFRERLNRRPNVDATSPDCVVHVHIHRDSASINFDLSGESLHRRGYRLSGTDAMLQETVAAAVLLRARWPDFAASGAPLIDPMCGSGTLPIEAAMIATDRAPGLGRSSFGFLKWKGHAAGVWSELLAEANERRESGNRNTSPIAAFDIDPRAVRAARANSERAGVTERIVFRTQPIERLAPEPGMKLPGIVVIDPPYGERTGVATRLEELYRRLGDTIKATLPGWHGALLASDPQLSKASGLWARRVNSIRNGSIKCSLALFDVHLAGNFSSKDPVESEYREIFRNRLQKNMRSLREWKKLDGIRCYRVYDADIPEFAVSIDLFEERWALVEELQPPRSVAADRAMKRRQIILVKSVVDTEEGEPAEEAGVFREIHESGLSFLIRFGGAEDAGFRLDHRILRQRLRSESGAKHVAILFSRAGASSICAAAGGASSVTSVDPSSIHAEWARENFELNGLFGDAYRFVGANVLGWLRNESAKFDLIFLDLCTVGRSTTSDEVRKVEPRNAHLRASLARLAEAGTLYYWIGRGSPVPSASEFPDFTITDISEGTMPFDFRRQKRPDNIIRFERATP